VDANRCLAWIVQADGSIPRGLRVPLGDRIYGCDECQEVCPPNQRVSRVAGTADGPDGGIDLLELLDLDDESLLDRYGRWYIAKRQPRFIRRNALVALGNVARPDDGRVVSVLERHLADPDPLLQAHAVWAARRLGRDDLVGAARAAGRLAAEAPEVAEELAAPEPPPRIRPTTSGAAR
jgi:epoxyqueuosine reductase